jgi:hypothetical protein
MTVSNPPPLSPPVRSRLIVILFQATRQEWNLDYDLAKIHKDSIYPWSQDYKSMKRKGKSFTRVEMELDISVTQGLLNTAVATRAELLWGRSKDFTGGLGAPGVQLAWLDIPSP